MTGNYNKPTRKQRREVARAIKALQYKLKGQGEREKARRVDQMVHEVCRAENGVVMQFEELTPETAQGIEQFEAEDAEREKEEQDGQD